MLHDETKREIEEVYASAGNSSSLRMLHSDRGSRNDVDVIAAAGMVRCRLGMMLLRLRSEWDRAAKPPEVTDAQIKMLAQSMPRIRQPFVVSPERMDSHRKTEPAQRRAIARQQAKDWHARARAKAFAGLRSWSAVVVDVRVYAEWQRMKVTDEVVSDVVAWWLDSRCAPHAPHGHVGQCLARYLDDCKARGANSLKKRLRASQPAS